jgi:FlaA1/EpsC-like NDP-sugar epimerase
VDLARDLIELTSAPNGPSVEIRFSGTRPGEKLYEEMFFNSENAVPTSHPKVLSSTRTSLGSDDKRGVETLIGQLFGTCGEQQLHDTLFALVTDYRTELATE